MTNRKALTLVELLVVVLILGALTAIAIPRITSSATTAKANACATNVDTMDSLVEVYNLETGDYPSALADVAGDTDFFPDGAPTCPLGGTYTMDGTSYRVSCSH